MRFLLIGLIAACATAHTPGWQVTPGTTHAVRDAAPVAHTDVTITSATVEPSVVPQAERLRVSVAELGFDDDFANALRRLADALELVAPSHGADIRMVRDAAADHRNFPRTSQRSAWMRDALDAAGRALSAGEPPSPTDLPSYEVAVAEVATATTAIDPAKPLYDQAPAVRTALNKMVRAIAIATGSAPSNSQEVLRLTLRNRAHRG